MINTRAYAVRDATSALAPLTFERREPGPHDVQIEILCCGICHSDLHQGAPDPYLARDDETQCNPVDCEEHGDMTTG